MATLSDFGLVDKSPKPGDAAKPTKLHKWRLMLQIGDDRPSLRFRATPLEAQRIKGQVELLLIYKGKQPPTELIEWREAQDDEIHAWLASIGLAEPRSKVADGGDVTLSSFLSQFISNLRGKPATKICYGNVQRNLEAFFGADKLVRDITTANADAFCAWLAEHDETMPDGKTRKCVLAPATVSRRIIGARTMWGKAMRWGMASTNPFVGIKAGDQTNDTRKAFVTRTVIDAVIAKAPGTEWKAIIALARYGGLRCPSEHYALKWGHVDFENNRMTVHSPKTERHQGKGSRVVPLFPELRTLLLNLFDEAPEGTEFVISKHRLGCLNLRQQFERIIESAGVKQWPKLFHNLRAPRETELMREYDLTTVCGWIGNSPAVAAKHYAMSQNLSADFQRAAGLPVGAKSGAILAQQAPETASTASQGPNPPNQNRSVIPSDADTCADVLTTGMGDTGLEPVTSGV